MRVPTSVVHKSMSCPHWSTNRALSVQTTTFRVDLKHQHPEVPLPISELSQRSRTLLFAGVAATLATARDIDTVTLGENGVMAINCPLTMGRLGGFSTHTAHPDILALMGNLFTQVLGKPVQIDNPLLYKTKTEVVADLVAANLGDLIPKTHSCWIARQARHCGVCVPCVVRRFAVEAAQAQDAVYEHDSFNDPSPRDDRKFASVGDYLLFARTIEGLSDEDLLLEFSELNIEGGPAMREPDPADTPPLGARCARYCPCSSIPCGFALMADAHACHHIAVTPAHCEPS